MVGKKMGQPRQSEQSSACFSDTRVALVNNEFFMLAAAEYKEAWP